MEKLNKINEKIPTLCFQISHRIFETWPALKILIQILAIRIHQRLKTKNRSPQELNNAKRGDLFVFNTDQVRDRVTEHREMFLQTHKHTQARCVHISLTRGWRWHGRFIEMWQWVANKHSRCEKVGGENKPAGLDAVRRTCFSYKRAEFPAPRSHTLFIFVASERTLCASFHIDWGEYFIIRRWRRRHWYYPHASPRNDDDKRFSIYISYVYLNTRQQRPPSSIFAQGGSQKWDIFLLGAKWSVSRILDWSVISLFWRTIAFCPHLQDAQFSPALSYLLRNWRIIDLHMCKL